MGSSFWYYTWDGPLYIEGTQVKILWGKKCISLFEDPFCLSKQCMPDEMHFIMVFTVCQSTHLEVTSR